MMKIKRLIAAGCVTILALTGCGAKEETPASAAKESSAVSSAVTNNAKESSMISSSDVSDAEGSTSVSPVVSSGETSDAKKIKLTIEGYDKDNFPRLDGSLANEPLLLRMID